LDSLEQLDYLVRSEVLEIREALVLRVLLEQLVAQVRRASMVLPDHRDSRAQLELLVQLASLVPLAQLDHLVHLVDRVQLVLLDRLDLMDNLE